MNNNTVVLTTMLNGEQAKKELQELEKRAKEANLAFREAKKSGASNMFDLKKEADSAKQALQQFKKETVDVNNVLKNLSTATPKELNKTLYQLNKQLNSGNIKRNSAEWNELNGKIRMVRNEMKLIKNESAASESFMSRAANGFNKYFNGAVAVVASITGASMAFRKMSEDVAKMDDVYADVMKTTGMTRNEVVALNEEFKKLNTRTAREELNQLARDAGKLGITGKKDVMDFVEAGNQINVALGEDLGEGAIRNIGKITEVYRRSTKELDTMNLKERMLAVGSAINELGQSSTANEDYLVDFSKRLGGVASQAGISVQDILGYASALDQGGQAVEMSATALQNFIMKVMGDPTKFARIAGLEVSEFTQLLRTDANEAIKTVLKSLSEKGGFQQLIPIFQEMGLDGARAVGVLSTLATSIDKVDEAQRISNEAFAEGTSLTNEYNVKNNNLMAQLEKRRKEFKDAALELGERLNPALLTSTNIVTRLVRILPSVLDFLGKYGPALIKVAALIVAYNLAVKAQTTWTRLALIEKTKMFIANQKEIAQQTLLAFRFVFTSGSAKQLSASLQALWSVTKINPLGLLVTLLTAVGYGIYEWTKHNSRLITQSEAMVEINKQVADTIGREQAELNMLLATARNEKISKEERLKAIQRLNEISPEYLGNLKLENINTDEARKSVDNYTKSLIENAKQKAIADETSQLYSKKLKNEAQILENEANLEKVRIAVQDKAYNSKVSFIMELKNNALKKENAEIDKQINIYTKLGETIDMNKTKSDDSYTSKFLNLEREKQLLSDLEKQHAALYAKTQPNQSGVLKDDFTSISNEPQFAEQAQLKFVSERLEKQRAIVAQKEKELGATKQIIKTENEGNYAPTTNKDNSLYEKKIKELEKYIAREKALIQEKYISGEINEKQYNIELEYLEQERLRKSLQAAGITYEQQKEIELKIFEYKKAALEKIEEEEREYFERMKELREQEAKDREEKNLNNLKKIAEQNEEKYKEQLQKEAERKAELLSLGFDFANEMGTMLGGAISGNEDMVASSLKLLINMALDFLKVQVEMAAVGITAQSLAQADSILTLGATGVARAAIIIGIIEAAFSAVKGVVSNVVDDLGGRSANQKKGYASGGYTPVGIWDEEAGMVHRNEFVGNRFAVGNPVVRKVFDVIDVAQRQNTVGNLTEKDFETALNYDERMRAKAVGALFDRMTTLPERTQENASLTAALLQAASINEKLSKQLEEPIEARTYIEGRGGSKEANDLYNRMKKNVSRTSAQNR